MKYLFIHQSFPAQFIHLSAALARSTDNTVVALTIEDLPVPAHVIKRKYSLLRNTNPNTHPLLLEEESKILRAEACAAAALQLKHEGFTPDFIYAHPGWGEALFIKDVFPSAKLIVYCEYYYSAENQDVGFDPEEPPISFAQRCKLRVKNTTNLLSMEIADAGISPTNWQKSTYPQWAQEKITVIHDGIDINRLKHNPAAKIATNSLSGKKYEFSPGAEVFSYVARNLEPVRGFHIFMRCLPKILISKPNSHAIIVGGDGVSYGRRAPDGGTWKQYLLKEIGNEISSDRVHFMGQVPYNVYLNLLSITKVHTYWTTPFVLSWSFLEAALSGLPVLASDTPPVSEFSEKLKVRTLPFFDHNVFSEELIHHIGKPTLRKNVSHSQTLSLEACLAAQIDFIHSL